MALQRILGLLALSQYVLSSPSPISWPDFDATGEQIAAGFNQFGSEVQNGFDKIGSEVGPVLSKIGSGVEQGITKIGSEMGPAIDTFGSEVQQGFNTFGSGVKQGVKQGINSMANGYNELEDQVVQRLDTWGLNQDGMQAIEDRMEQSLNQMQQAFNMQADILRKVKMPDFNNMATGIRESFIPIINYNSFPTNFGLNSWLNQYARKWWDGDNVCVTREELDEDDISGVSVSSNMNLVMQISQCEERYDLYTCTYSVRVDGERKAYKTTYSCCRGFKLDENKICKETDIRPVEETIADLDGADFLSFMSEENLVSNLRNSTIFLPTNDAIEKFKKEIESAFMGDDNNNVMYNVEHLKRRKRDLGLVISEEVAMKDMLLGHVSDEVFDLNSVTNNQLIPSKSGNALRMSVYQTYPKRTVLANCALVTSKDHHTETSTIHVIDSVIKPATKTIGDILTNDVQFRSFSNLLDKVTLDKLSVAKDSFTVFVPTEASFQELDDIWVAKISSGKSCSNHIIESHIVPTVVCSSVVTGKVQVTNSVDERMELTRDENGKVYVEERELVMKDIIASNGVIHVIESVILPKSAKTAADEIKERNGQKFLDLIKKADMMDNLDELKDSTVLLPSAHAMNEIDENLLGRLSNDEDELKEILQHHIIPHANNKMRISRRTEVQESLAGIKHHMNHNSVSCARIQSRKCGKVCGGTVVEVDRLLVPPGGSILQLLQASSEHSKFLSLLEQTGLSEEIADGHFTVFAPTNSAFDSIPDNLKARLLNNNDDELKKILRVHILPDVVCCSSAPSASLFSRYSRGHRSLAATSIMMTRSYEGHVLANGIKIDRCDTIAVNGLLHSINSVILPRHMQMQQTGSNFLDPFGMGF